MNAQPPQPNIWQRWWQRYRSASRPLQAGIGCGALLVVIALCGILGVALSSGGNTASPASTAPTGQIAQETATPTPPATATPAPTSTPKPVPTNTPQPPPTAAAAPTCDFGGAPQNPWCYTFTYTGKYIYEPPAEFCTYFNCIASFWDGTGYVVECKDGKYSKSGGTQGVCSRHDGLLRTLYAP